MEKMFIGKCPCCDADCYGEAGQTKVICEYCGTEFDAKAMALGNEPKKFDPNSFQTQGPASDGSWQVPTYGAFTNGAPAYGAAPNNYQGMAQGTKKKSSTGLVIGLVILIVVLVLAAFGLGGYVIYNRIVLPAVEQTTALNQGLERTNPDDYNEDREIPDQDPELNPENWDQDGGEDSSATDPDSISGGSQGDGGDDNDYGSSEENDNTSYDEQYPNDIDLKIPEMGLEDKNGFSYYGCRNIVTKDMIVKFPEYWDTERFDDEEFIAYNYDDEFAMFLVTTSDGVEGYNLSDEEIKESFLGGLIGALDNGELVSSENRTIGNIDGLYAEYKANYSGVDIKGTIFAFIDGDILYGYQLGESSGNAHDYTPDFVRSLETITSVVEDPSYKRDDSEDLSSYTKGERLAILQAKSYLRSSAFSRDGLIHQLSAEYGEGFTVSVATMAVDHLEETGQVDWYEQCLKAIDEIVKYGSDDSRDYIFRLLTLEDIRAFPEDMANKALDEKGY